MASGSAQSASKARKEAEERHHQQLNKLRVQVPLSSVNEARNYFTLERAFSPEVLQCLSDISNKYDCHMLCTRHSAGIPPNQAIINRSCYLRDIPKEYLADIKEELITALSTTLADRFLSDPADITKGLKIDIDYRKNEQSYFESFDMNRHMENREDRGYFVFELAIIFFYRSDGVGFILGQEVELF